MREQVKFNNYFRALLFLSLLSWVFLSARLAYSGNILSQFIRKAKLEHLPADVLEVMIEQLDPAPKDLIKLASVNQEFKLASERVMVTSLRKILGDKAFDGLFPLTGFQGEDDHKKAIDYYKRLIRASHEYERHTTEVSIPFQTMPMLPGRPDVRMFFSPLSPDEFFTVHVVVNGYELHLWNGRLKSNSLLLSSEESFEDLVFTRSNPQLIRVIVADGSILEVDLAQPTSFSRLVDRSRGRLIKTHRFDQRKYQVVAYRKKTLIWSMDSDEHIAIELPLTENHTIMQSPFSSDLFLIVDQMRCEASYWDFSRGQRLRLFTGRKICQAFFPKKSPGTLVTLERLFREVNGRIYHYYALKQIDVKYNKDIQSQELLSQSDQIALYPRPDVPDQFFLLDDSESNPSFWSVDPLEKVGALDYGQIHALYPEERWRGDPLSQKIIPAGTTEDPKLISWVVDSRKRTQIFYVWSAVDLAPRGVMRSNSYGFFTYVDGATVHPLNRDLFMINSMSGLFLKDLKVGNKSILLSQDFTIDAYGVSPYFPHVMAAVGNEGYFWNLLDSLSSH